MAHNIFIDPLKTHHVFVGLVNWYQTNKRHFPWRILNSPYAVWISEVILQQTQTTTGINYFLRFINRFPNVKELASASIEDVLQMWSGLGYYNRAHHLHKAAKIIFNDYQGVFPQTRSELEDLPGIGPYTAGAILSIAFSQPEPAVDGNVVRVLSRLYAISHRNPHPSYWEIAEKLVQNSQQFMQRSMPGDFNQALMDLGATICRPVKPLCTECPVKMHCTAFQTGTIALFPPPKQKRTIPIVQAICLLVYHQQKIYLLRQPTTGLWKSMLTLPYQIVPSGQALEDYKMAFSASFLHSKSLSAVTTHTLSAYTHVLTHRIIEFFSIVMQLKPQDLTFTTADEQWVNKDELADKEIPAWVTRIITHYEESKE